MWSADFLVQLGVPVSWFGREYWFLVQLGVPVLGAIESADFLVQLRVLTYWCT